MAKAKDFFSLIKFSHTVFALPFAIIGFCLGVKANHDFSTTQIGWLFLKVLICMIAARTAAMAFNRYIDRRFDALNPRTAVREIPSKIISPNQALLLTILSSLALLITTFFIQMLSRTSMQGMI
jgi:4-hydroxybenzoate polyprenyltransferase